jgi:hypothetical protein
LQPLDISIYGPFKAALRNSFSEWLNLHPGQRISIYEVAELTRVPYLEKFTTATLSAMLTFLLLQLQIVNCWTANLNMLCLTHTSQSKVLTKLNGLL